MGSLCWLAGGEWVRMSNVMERSWMSLLAPFFILLVLGFSFV